MLDRSIQVIERQKEAEEAAYRTKFTNEERHREQIPLFDASGILYMPSTPVSYGHLQVDLLRCSLRAFGHLQHHLRRLEGHYEAQWV